MKVLVFNCRKLLEINCRKLLVFTCFLQQHGFTIFGSRNNEWKVYQCGSFIQAGKNFQNHGVNITRKSMAEWVIKIGERYLSILYDRLHENLLNIPILQADETPVLVNKDGRPAGSKSYRPLSRAFS